MKKLTKKKIYVISAAAILVLGGYYWYKKSNSTTGQVSYVTQAAEKGTLTTSISASGNVTVDQSATVDPTITGTVANLAISVGDSVKKGDFLFNIINDDLGISADKALTSYKSAAISKDQAKADYDQAIREEKNDSHSHLSSELDILKDELQLAKDQEDTAWENYLSAKEDADKRKVVASIDGTINAINIKNGDDLSRVSGSSSNAQAPITIGDLSTLKVEVPVNEVDIINVKTGQKAVLTFDAIPDFTATGKVEKIDSLGTVTSGVVTYNVLIGFDELDPRIKPDMSVSANVITEVIQNALIVPSEAVKDQGNGTYVEVLNFGNTPKRVNIEVRVSNSTQTAIKSGINEGDKVVTRAAVSGTSSSAPNSTSSRSGVRIPGLGGFGH